MCSYSFFLQQQPKERPQEEWMREKRVLERKMAELQTALQEERRVRKAEKQMLGHRKLIFYIDTSSNNILVAKLKCLILYTF